MERLPSAPAKAKDYENCPSCLATMKRKAQKNHAKTCPGYLDFGVEKVDRLLASRTVDVNGM